MNFCFVQNTDWKMNRRRNNWFQRLKMKFHISAKNLFLDSETPDDCIYPPYSKDSNMHLRINEHEAVVPVICEREFTSRASDKKRNVKPNTFFQKLKMKYFGCSAYNLFHDIA